MSAAALSVRGVRKTFGGRRALDGVSLDVALGSCVALVGPSGSGKTTLLRIAAGLETADDGRVEVGGVVTDDPAPRVPPERRGVGLLFQDLALWPHRSVRGNIELVLDFGRVPKARWREECAAAAAAAGLPESLLDAMPGVVSGGERQRAAIARLLAQRPKLALLDEPLSHLDPHLRAGILELLRGLREERGLATLLVTHDHAEAFALADRLAVIDGGRIVQEGAPEDVYRRPASAFVARFLGRADLLPAARRGAGVVTALGEFPLPDDARAGSGPLLAVFREENLHFVSTSDPYAPRGAVVLAEFAGSAWIAAVDVRTAGGPPVRVHVRCAERPARGAEVALSADLPVFVPAESPGR